MARAQTRLRSRSRGSAGSLVAGVALIVLAILALGGLGYFYFTVPRKPVLDRASLCPVDGPRGITVVLVDASDDLPAAAQREVLGLLKDEILALPSYYKFDIRVLDIPVARSRSLFSKCNPGDGSGLSEWTDNPQIARMRWIESFDKPAQEAMKWSLASAKAKSSPIMGAIQDIALDEFSSASVREIPKKLIVISDMLEYTSAYGQYPSQGDLSFQRYKQSPAYLNYRTDLHGARLSIDYVQRAQVKIDAARHIQFWNDWTIDSKGTFEAHRLQGAG